MWWGGAVAAVSALLLQRMQAEALPVWPASGDAMSAVTHASQAHSLQVAGRRPVQRRTAALQGAGTLTTKV